MSSDTPHSVIWDHTNADIFLSCPGDFTDRPAGTWARCVQEMSSGGEKQHLSVPLAPQVLDAHLDTPNMPSGTYRQVSLLLYFWLSFLSSFSAHLLKLSMFSNLLLSLFVPHISLKSTAWIKRNKAPDH